VRNKLDTDSNNHLPIFTP